jgi:hypothetical protein
LVRIDDSVPARLTPFSLLLNRTLYLDGWVEPYFAAARGPLGIYFAIKSHDHWVSVYPLITPLVVSPLYVFPAWWIAHQRPPLSSGDVVLVAVIDVMEKLSASVLAALSAGILYSAFRKVASPAASLVVTLVYALASNTWTISSQALWRHGLTELSFALLLWALLAHSVSRAPLTPNSVPQGEDGRRPGEGWHTFLAGLGVAMAAANKPGNAIIGLAVFLYFARGHRNRLILYCAPIFAIGTLVMFYNLHYFGHILGPTPQPFYRGLIHGRIDLSHSTMWQGFIGLLVSPNRGLLIYMPWVVFAFWGAARLWKENTFGWEHHLIVSIAAVFLAHTRYWGWWGGWCFGPRYLTDLLPFLAFFLIPVWPRIVAARWLRSAFILAAVAGFCIQVVGAFYYPGGRWDARPVSVDRDTGRIWDWSDTQIMRSWRAGRAYPELYDESYLLFSQLHAGQTSLSGERGSSLYSTSSRPAAESESTKPPLKPR